MQCMAPSFCVSRIAYPILVTFLTLKVPKKCEPILVTLVLYWKFPFQSWKCGHQRTVICCLRGSWDHPFLGGRDRVAEARRVSVCVVAANSFSWYLIWISLEFPDFRTFPWQIMQFFVPRPLISSPRTLNWICHWRWFDVSFDVMAPMFPHSFCIKSLFIAEPAGYWSVP